MNTNEHTKWYITARFEYPDGTEETETRYFWSQVAESETEALERFDNPIKGGEVLEVYHIATQEDFFGEREADNTPPVVTETDLEEPDPSEVERVEGDEYTREDAEAEEAPEETEEDPADDIILA